MRGAMREEFVPIHGDLEGGVGRVHMLACICAHIARSHRGTGGPGRELPASSETISPMPGGAGFGPARPAPRPGDAGSPASRAESRFCRRRFFPPAAAREERVALSRQTGPQERLASSVAHVEGLVDSGAIVGAVLYVEQGGEVLCHRALGWSDRERGVRMSPGAVFRMRSMTKPLVGTAALMLCEQGRLALHDHIAHYIPAFDNDAKRGITVRQLLTHTSGLTGGIYDTLAGTQFATLREAVDWVGRAGPMGFAPGTAFHYSDPGSSTLGALVAEVSGEPAEDFIRRRITEPLGMTDSFLNLVPEDDPRRSRIAATYQGKAGAWVRYWDNTQPQVLPFFRASGGLYSTAADYATFLRAFLRGGALGEARLLKPETVRMALVDCTAHLMTPAQVEERASTYGMHWTLYDARYAPLPRGTFGHGGSDGTVGLADPTRGLIVVFLTQSRGNDTRRGVVAKVMEAVG